MQPFLAILNIGTFELLVLAGGAVLLFGGDLPQTARKVARVVARIRGMVADLGAELNPPPELKKPPRVDMGQDEIRSIVAEVKRHDPFVDEGRDAASVPPQDKGSEDAAKEVRGDTIPEALSDTVTPDGADDTPERAGPDAPSTDTEPPAGDDDRRASA